MSTRLIKRRVNKDKSTLYLIATPIGNLSDITYRAVEVLNSVDIIYAEDTRVTAKLLNHYGIKKPLNSYHIFNEKDKITEIRNHLENGLNVGFCSDAGMPVINDPGYLLVSELKDLFNVVIIPGVTSPITALAGSSLPANSFSFLGFVEKKEQAKIKQLQKYVKIDHTLIFFEASNRLVNTLNIMHKVFGKRRCVVARELTKLYETYYEFTLGDDITDITLKGEFVILVEGYIKEEAIEKEIVIMLEKLLKENKTLKEAINIASSNLDIGKNQVYDLALKYKLNKE